MNKFVGSALALALTGSLGYASNDTDSEWLGLDQEINSLSSTMSTQGGGVDVGALIRSSFLWSDEDNTFGDDDLLGWNLNDLDFWVEGSVGDFDWRFNVDFDGLANQGSSLAGTIGDGVQLEDAYVDIPAHESLHIRWGNIKVPTLRSNSIYPEYLLFKNRTVIGSAFDFWDLGVMVWGEIEQFSWFVALQNSVDARANDLAYTIRLQVEIGEASSHMEGAYGTSQDLQASLGIFYRDDTDDDVGDDRRVIGLDAAATFEMFSLYGEIIDIDDDIGGFTQSDFRAIEGLFLEGDSTPWSLTASFLFVPDEWEAAIRYEDLDNQDDTWLLSIGLNWYRSGHNAKWQLAWIQANSDNDAVPDGSAIVLSLVLGHSTSS